MITSREELMRVASDWINHATNDVRQQIQQFIATQRTSVRELAYVLGVDEAFLNGVLNGTTTPTLELFAKILIATDNILEVKPISATPMGQHGRGARLMGGGMPTPPRHMGGGMPQMPMGGMPMPPLGTNGYPMPPQRMGGMPMPPQMPMGGAPIPPQFGGQPPIGQSRRGMMPQAPMQPQTPIPAPMVEEDFANAEPLDDLASMQRGELVNLIRNSGWGNEIDLAVASRTNLINLIQSRRANGVQGTVPSAVEAPVEDLGVDMDFEGTPVEETVDVNAPNPQMAAFQDMIERELAANPNLRGVLEQYRQ